ncbi:MAG TPA: LAGLIDADG family homing endonuclease [Nitrososphaerales archaeon]|nr:LAGLIDADG family homing endonuclease [Nitrososphaerales archaeon]
MGTRSGVRLRPTMERDRLYHLVLDLRKQGLSYNQIIKQIEAEHGAKLCKSQLSDWISGGRRPFGYVRIFEATPRRELAYVVGVTLGDGSTSSNRNHNHKIKLRVIDEEFAEEFARCLGVLLRRNAPLVKWREKTRSWYTEVSSLLLQKFLRQDLRQLIPTVSHCDDCKAGFLRGFFDSEGSMYARALTASNENLNLMEFVCELLQSLNIQTTGIHLATKGGRTVMIKGKFYRQNEDLFYLRVRSASLARFQTTVGFSVLRKSATLSQATNKKD